MIHIYIRVILCTLIDVLDAGEIVLNEDCWYGLWLQCAMVAELRQPECRKHGHIKPICYFCLYVSLSLSLCVCVCVYIHTYIYISDLHPAVL